MNGYTRKIETLHSWEHNPRSVTKEGLERLKKQIRKLGIYKPLLITDDGTVLGGNMRLQALKEMGHKHVWVSVVKAETDEKKIEYALSDNDRVGKYEAEDLANLIGSFPDVEWSNYTVDLDDPTSIEDLMERFSEIEEDEAPEIEAGPADSKLGEVYQLGNHRLLCGDATKPESYEKLMNGQKAHMVFTDPPYNIDYTGGMNAEGKNDRAGIMNDNMSDSAFYDFLHDSMVNMMLHCEGVFYICMSSKELSNLKKAFTEAGGHWQSYIIWVKNHFTISRSDYQNQYEPILYGWNGKTTNHYFIDDRGMGNVWSDIGQRAKYVDGKTEITVGGTKIVLDGKVTGKITKGKRRTDIWEYAKPAKSEEHPTMKPVRLCAEAIKNSSKQGEIVLDCFLGSGSTLIAAEQTGRTCYGMELDPHYCDVIRKRYENFITSQSKSNAKQ